MLPIKRQDRPDGVSVPRPVLIVDDSKAQRKILSMQLTRWGYPTVEAASGEEALALCQATDFQIVLSDWMMPGMTGLEFCKAFRRLPREGYGYFILLTSKSEKTEIADGLENGADDFLTKPVSSDELRARLRAGERILGMQDELVEKNRLIGSTLGELQKLYDSLDRDLIEARKLQQALVRDRQLEFATGSASVLLRPSGHVGGDLVGTFQINPTTIAIYSVDVAGHGIASAMMTARLAALLSGGSPDQNIAMSAGAYGRSEAWPPEMVAHRLNRMMTEGFVVDQYFTMAYAEIDLFTGQVRMVQAGHPHPLVMRAAGGVDKIGAGGMPIGLIEGCSYNRITFSLSRGDRLFLMSDGITECPNPQGEELGVDGLIAFLNKSKGLKSSALLEALMWDLADFAGQTDFPDDVSGILFDYRGPT
ncbi:MAG: fused response regulator/phosphatase [Rhodobacterales bacterium RIFCSPHIGHO2_02_FULL_62_130]|nr:MAG: fused response regulator/phosphatase [Rhodobacterales bacterium RIFCSPHIGHO2_02_FULL_62_130]OHC56854.1 MAG: fused response regulator/phosphatase [Rhodobacterales bacterium RIFCSPHIGHO2_12_FULL_62_75]